MCNIMPVAYKRTESAESFDMHWKYTKPSSLAVSEIFHDLTEIKHGQQRSLVELIFDKDILTELFQTSSNKSLLPLSEMFSPNISGRP